ncbi:unnamed protein product (macronuclear) [Paramecium tetraurelia]|uniref:GRIP domain-containing protein n=1 Tax=Paramecium tetraurelia TaxID=5888 RepID=A0CXF7_PARTE|nr:uncharacterized protein GSPATT00011106001 [Paramecium tetraurelia]CAK75474.1 unnamed protein product [Paramecium tetraurelia]|eukprot:XP_001442871.1 hypothetical protein (macronuclear) [Paramecium tetraurelia strain d4-2]
MLYSIRESEAEGNISTDSYTANKSINQDTNLTKKSSSRSLPKRQKDLDEEIQNLNNVINKLRKVEQLLLNQIKDLKHQLEVQYKSSNKDQECIDELNKELNSISNKLHHEIMHNSQQQKTNIELQKSILKLEQDLITSNQKNQDISEELQIVKSKYSNEHKFVESLLHMVISCHPEHSFREQPSLKQAWKWLKSILSDYLALKQQTRNQKEGSSQSSSSTSK